MRWLTPAVVVPPLPLRFSSFAALLLSGCASLHGTPTRFDPLPPASFGGSHRAEQILNYTQGERSMRLQSYVEVSPEKMSVLATTALGQRVLQVSLDASGLHVETALPDGAVSPEEVLGNLQLALWPLPALQAALAGTDWTATEPVPGTRRIARSGLAYAEIHYAGRSAWDGRWWLVNFEQRYSLDIESKTVK
jgi:hypothetical protein